MRVYLMDTDYDEAWNSPWDAVWYDGDQEDMDALHCQMRLGAIWRPPTVRVEKRLRTPDIYVFLLNFAVSEHAKEILSTVVQDTAEFLPLSTDVGETLFVLHPLWRAELDERAVVSKGSGSGNITVVRKYSFDLRDFDEPMPIFQARQAVGSAARDAGAPCPGVLVSDEFRLACVANGLRGVVFNEVWASGSELDK
ncbi:MAG: hypothetical protein LC130_13960 [Bryobacterales bacterium]|nr:hypothetical protein [Bryobacterales bacterium]